MTMEIFAIGGYEEVGKNMTAVKIDDQIIILDVGIALDKLMLWEENGGEALKDADLTAMGVIPDDTILKKYRNKVSAIIVSHAHLDHIGAIGNLAAKYNAPVIGTPFTIALLKRNLKDDRVKEKPKEMVIMNAGEIIDLGDISIEFIHMTHSVPQTVLTAIHAPEGIAFYASDYKFDNYQELQKPPDYKRLKKLGKQGVKLAIPESVRVDEALKTPSETVAREILNNTITETLNEDNGILVTCFSSHIERLNSITKVANDIGRQVVFLGRSMQKYTSVAEEVGITNFDGIEIFGKQPGIRKQLTEINKNKKDYLVVATGGQGEPGAVLSRIANNEYKNYQIEPGDEIIFSCIVIPNPTNIEARAKLESKLKFYGARIFRDVHASGHAAKEDHRDLIHMLQPEHIVPFHGDIHKLAAYADLTAEMNKEYGEDRYTLGETVHIMRNGQKLTI